MMNALLFLTLAHAGTNPVKEAEHVVWLGIDYSQVQMIGTTDFNDADEIFPGYLEKWNTLYLTEQLEELSARVKQPIKVDVGGVTAANNNASGDQILREAGHIGYVDQPNITRAQREEMLAGYTLDQNSGVGLVFVMEYMLKEAAQACLYVTFVDLSDRSILAEDRQCLAGGGFGFRNFWFRPVKEATAELKKTIKNLW